MFEFSAGTKLPVANGLAARALLGAGIVAVGANGVVASENVGHWGAMRSLTSSNSFEIGVDLKVLGGRVLHEMQQSDGDDENRQKQLKEPILVQRPCRDKHLRRCLFDPRPRVFHRSQSNLFFFFYQFLGSEIWKKDAAKKWIFNVQYASPYPLSLPAFVSRSFSLESDSHCGCVAFRFSFLGWKRGNRLFGWRSTPLS
jgi:hypothetical protein